MISDLPHEPLRVLTGSLSWIVRSPFDDLWSWMSSKRAESQRVVQSGAGRLTLIAVK
jgi:hypothetical protein